jgi:predicted transcriptional regulator
MIRQEAATALLRHRTPGAGPEEQMVVSALASLRDAFGSSCVFMRELQMPTGVPDAVAVLMRNREVPFDAARLNIGSSDLRLLHHLATVKQSTVNDIEAALRWTTSDLRRMIRTLTEAGLLRETHGSVRVHRLADIFHARKIIAVEAKMKDWQRAIMQAVANTWFASHSYILLPERPLSNSLNETAKRFGIGVLTFDGQRTRTRIRASARPLPASYGSWLVHENALRMAQRSST